MTEAIHDPAYWKKRLKDARELHQAVYLCSHDHWQNMERQHRAILARIIKADDRILDFGCAWGRLLKMLPACWSGDYWGVDLSPDFIELARHQHPLLTSKFMAANILDVTLAPGQPKFNWVIAISIKPMIVRNQGQEYWDKIEAHIHTLAERLLLLEYEIL